MEKQLKRSIDGEIKGRRFHFCKSEKWFWRTMAVIAVVAAALMVVAAVQHIWLTQILINGMAS